jgi:hypothetical protein
MKDGNLTILYTKETRPANRRSTSLSLIDPSDQTDRIPRSVEWCLRHHPGSVPDFAIARIPEKSRGAIPAFPDHHTFGLKRLALVRDTYLSGRLG